MDPYRLFAAYYDLSLERLYRGPREILVREAGLSEGEVVLDLACGTGQGLPGLAGAVGSTGRVVGVDASAAMLQRARARIARAGWTHVEVVEGDLLALATLTLPGVPEAGADHAICALGMTVVPDPRAVCEAAVARLRPGGRLTVFDVHAERRNPQTCIVEWMASADLDRRVWEDVEAVCVDVRRVPVPGSPWIHGGTMFVASGVRR